MMTKKVHPNSAETELFPRTDCPCGGGKRAALTVWRKSLLFNGNGFTVFDARGDLVFRVDNYSSGSRDEIVLMDAAGKPLLTIRRKKLSLEDHWLVYCGEEATNPQFAVKKHTSLRNSKTLARVTPCILGTKAGLTYDVEGSYTQRCCAIYDNRQRQLMEIKKKESVQGVTLGLDVFRLIMEPEIDASFAMAIVIVLDQMFGSRASFSGGER